MAPKKPCFAFQRGKCKYGAKCKYEHTKNSSAPKLKPCEHFAKNRCNRGAACKFSHDPDDIAAFKARAPDPECNQEKQSTEAEFRRWRYNIPEEPSEMRKLGSDVNGFWQKAYQLTTGDLSVRQQVIDLFASAGGLKRIEELLDQTSSDLTGPQLERIFTARLLPFFQMLTNPDVCDSPLLQSKFGTILNYIYGFGGQRAVSTFTAVARHLSSLMLTLPSKDVHEDNILAFECSVVLFDKVTKLNTPSQVHKGLAPIANSISALVEDTPSDHLTFALRKTKEHLGRLNTRLKIGQDRPQMAGEAPKQGPVPTFKVSKDGPGIQSEDGPRHDNDNIDIREISILPTLQELQSSRIEYLPSADPHDWHVVGLGGLLDRNFRLLREDTVGQLRDAAKFELERLQHPRRQADIQRRHQGPRCNVYENAKLQDIAFDPRAAMEIVLRFGQPHVLHSKSERQRRDWWEASKRLAAESLLCLLGSDGTAIFFTVAQEPRDFKHKDAELERARGRLHNNYDLYSDPLYAHVIVQLVTQDDSRTFFKRLIGNHNTRFSIVEFSGVLLASFLPTLQSMQHMSSSLDLPFAGIIAPVSTSADPNQVVEVPLPAYATRPGFTFNLSGLTTDGTDVRLLPGKRIAETVEELQAHTTLDAGQAEALASSLSRSLALIQGPPGTGKSHTGLQILRSLLANKANIKMGPILCVTFTNHALDQVLERSLDNGITQIVRIGGRSKSERLAELNLRVVAKQQELTKTEKSDRWGLMKQIEAEAKEINHILGDFEGIHADRQPQLEAYLLANHPEHHKQLFGEADEDGWERVNRHKRSVIENWLTLGPRNQSEPRTLDELHDVHVNDMFRRERERLYGSWVADMKLEVLFRLKTAMKAYHKNKAELDLIRTEVDLRVLKQADIVGVTTSGLARNIDLLRRSNAKVLVCEEAGEVLEAHQLTALLPSIEHAILIGDHQQLRPHVQNYDLSVESKSGAAYALDISLFERLVQPSNLLASPLPLSKLDIQRRMHPWISEFPTLIYPDLKDAATVSNYPEVPGLKHRLFWLDHERLENGDTDAQTTSRTNDYECDMVAGLVSHLVKQGVYSAGDIAVITPYLGQLRKIRNKLSSSFEILLNGRDQDELAQEGGEDGVPETTDESAPRNQVARGTLLSALRVATVDNFQGEEAKVVVVSLVRSNDAGRAGFLKTSNRINVLLSRAQHGMYLVGNGRTMETVPMWREVLDIFRAKNLIGGALELCCPRHPETPLFVKEPDDFIRVAPEAGCDRICNDRLPCGHRDASKCHSELLHQAVFCLEPCNRPPPGCSVHVCPDPCGAACPKECTAPMNDVSVTPPNCDHEHTSLPCYQVRDPSRIVCEVMVTRTVEACGHVVNVPCHVDVNGPAFLCDAKCGANLEGCGHMCRKKCYNCRKSVNGEAVVDHGTCNQVCGRKFTTCSHSDRKACHGAEGCKPCKAKCEVACSHSACSRACWESCVPCAESDCRTPGCSMPCAAPCNSVPLSNRCEEILACGCQCPSVAGETCPSQEFCQKCGTEENLEQSADYIELKAYREIDLDEEPCIFTACGHIFTITSLDGIMDMAKFYEVDPMTGGFTKIKKSAEPFSSDELKTCPACRGSLRDIARYGRIVRRAMLDESVKKLTVWANRRHFELNERVAAEQERLLKDVDTFRKPNQNVSIGGATNNQISSVRSLPSAGRYRGTLQLHQDISRFVKKLRQEEQPYQRIQDLVETARRQNVQAGIERFEFDSSELQLREYLQASSLLLRCEIVLFSDIVNAHHKTPPSHHKGTLDINFDRNRAACEALITDARTAMSVLQEAEGHVFWARFAALEVSVGYEALQQDSDALQRAEQHNERGLKHLEDADAVCEKLGDASENLRREIKEVRRMLNEGTSESEMRMVVAAMAREFSGTGHWYRCVNGHPFTVGECGMPMELARCGCGAGIGGQSHRPREGVEHAGDLEERFGGMAL